MASGTVGAEERGAANGSAKLVEYDQYIDQQIRRTRNHVKVVDIACAIMTLCGGICALMLVAALLDHWVVTGGLGMASRTAGLAVLVGGSVTFLARRLTPLLTRRINPLYAARAIEMGTPSLKNSLLNFLFFRQDQAGIPRAVYEAVEQQAATRLAHASVETTVDRTHLIHVGYGLLSIVIVAALYTVLSPKSPFITAERILLPWSDIRPPTRVAITAVAPGDTTVARGESITVTAQVVGAREDEPVRLFYTTAGQQTVDRELAMHVPAGRYRYVCRLPEGPTGVRQELTYRIEAGDAIAGPFQVTVTAAPTIVVQRVDYTFPAYTGWAPRQVDREGDIKAIEGTRVTLHAVANEPIGRATIEFHGDRPRVRRETERAASHGRETPQHAVAREPAPGHLRMKTDGTKATAHFRLAFDPAGHVPWHDGYLLRLRTKTGRENLQPVRYRIEVTPDLAPEIEWKSPRADDVDLPLDGTLRLVVTANDPDFALGQVAFHAAANGRPIWKRSLLEHPREEPLQGKATFCPREAGAKVGDAVTLWAVAVDNKTPKANERETGRKRIHVTAPRNRTRPKGADAARPNRNHPGWSREKREQRGPAGRQQAATPPEDSRQDGQDAASSRDDDAQRPESGRQENGGQQGRDAQSPGGDRATDQPAAGGPSEENRSGGASQQPSAPPAGSEPGGEAAQDGPSDGQGGQEGSPHRGGSRGKASGRRQAGGRSGAEGEDEREHGSGEAGESASGAVEEKDGHGGRSPQQGARSSKSDQRVDEETRQPVASDGSDDGSVFEKLLKWLEQPPRRPPAGARANTDGQPAPNAADGREGKPAGDASGRSAAGDRAAGRQAGSRPTTQAEPRTGKVPEAGAKQGSQQMPDAGAARDRSHEARSTVGDAARGDAAQEKKDRQPGGAAGERGGEPARPKPRPESNGKPGGESGPDDAESPSSNRAGRPASGGSADSAREDRPDDRPAASGEKTKPRQADRSTGQAGGDRDHPKGAAGKGGPQPTQGAPEPQNALRPRPKTPGDSDSPTHGDQQPPKSPAGGTSESDSQSDQAGDKPGGGQEGGGQRANKQGTGSSGQNRSADAGSGASNESGQGDASGRAGNHAESASPTGQAGGRSRGAGTESSSSARGPAKASPRGQPASGSPGKGAKGRGAVAGVPQGGGQAGPNGGAAPPHATAEPGGDPANLQYARESTDLVLRRLEKELAEGRADSQLLDKLGWKQSDLRRFLHRWQQMYRNARQPGKKGAAARQELNEALRSLGLRRDRLLFRSHATKDRLQQMQESLHTAPPWEYRQPLRAYLRGTSRARGEPDR